MLREKRLGVAYFEQLRNFAMAFDRQERSSQAVSVS